jgi:hypothetical protein
MLIETLQSKEIKHVDVIIRYLRPCAYLLTFKFSPSVPLPPIYK